MTPAQTWTAIAVFGLIFTAWNIWDGWDDWKRARKVLHNGIRRIATEMFLLMVISHFIGYLIWLWIGVDALRANVAGTWSQLVWALVAAESVFVLKSILLRVFRYRINHHVEKA